MSIVEFLREYGDERVRALTDVILHYEATIDSEWGCCHQPEEIASGQCSTSPEDIRGLKILAAPHAWRSAFQKEWLL